MLTNRTDFKISEVKFMVVGVSACKYTARIIGRVVFCHIHREETDTDYFVFSVTSTSSRTEKEGELYCPLLLLIASF